MIAVQETHRSGTMVTPASSPSVAATRMLQQAGLRRSVDSASLLRSVPFFSSLAADALSALAERMQVRAFGRSETIFQQGEAGDALFLIARGQVRITTPTVLGRELTVALFRAGDFFGELALLDDGPRSASAVAMAPTVTLVLERWAFRQLLRDAPSMAEALLA
jgi:CRP-like cAMP-binding protein